MRATDREGERKREKKYGGKEQLNEKEEKRERENEKIK